MVQLYQDMYLIRGSSVEFSTGSLGHGLPVAIGIALNAKLLGSKYKTVCLMGDGECNEGTTWESALIASHHKLSSLTVIIDANKYQSLRTTKETLNMDPMSEKWDSFGWEVLDIDGHNINEIKSALHHEVDNKPKCIIANTIKEKVFHLWKITFSGIIGHLKRKNLRKPNLNF